MNKLTPLETAGYSAYITSVNLQQQLNLVWYLEQTEKYEESIRQKIVEQKLDAVTGLAQLTGNQETVDNQIILFCNNPAPGIVLAES